MTRRGRWRQLYRARWHAELDLRPLKVTLGMDVLRCQSPEMVRKELWVHLLAYNLIRAAMAQAAVELEVLPREVSFKGAVQAVTAFAERLLEADAGASAELHAWLLLVIASQAVGDRPDRVEPRLEAPPQGVPATHQAAQGSPKEATGKVLGARKCHSGLHPFA